MSAATRMSQDPDNEFRCRGCRDYHPLYLRQAVTVGATVYYLCPGCASPDPEGGTWAGELHTYLEEMSR